MAPLALSVCGPLVHTTIAFILFAYLCSTLAFYYRSASVQLALAKEKVTLKEEDFQKLKHQLNTNKEYQFKQGLFLSAVFIIFALGVFTPSQYYQERTECTIYGQYRNVTGSNLIDTNNDISQEANAAMYLLVFSAYYTVMVYFARHNILGPITEEEFGKHTKSAASMSIMDTGSGDKDDS
jgi:uncharacterized membrane protein